MRERRRQVDIAAWTLQVRADPEKHRHRQAVHIVMQAVTSRWPQFHLKGGLLMTLVYGSRRMTTDIDFSASGPAEERLDRTIKDTLNAALETAALDLGYPFTTVRVHKVTVLPEDCDLAEARHPALKIKIRAATRRLDRRKPTLNHLSVDISFNECISSRELIVIHGGPTLAAYSLEDLVAEKYRAVLQQIIRKRRRRQDVYDLHHLITTCSFDERHRERILRFMKDTCASQGIAISRNSLDDPDIRQRSGEHWDTLESDTADVILPSFDLCFDTTREFYRALPWRMLPSND